MTDARTNCIDDTVGSVLVLSQHDNVVIVCANMTAGMCVLIDNEVIALDRDAPIGFKLARETISKSKKIVKYGVQIGSATTTINKGAVIHLHNMKSNYLPTFTLEEASIEKRGSVS